MHLRCQHGGLRNIVSLVGSPHPACVTITSYLAAELEDIRSTWLLKITATPRLLSIRTHLDIAFSQKHPGLIATTVLVKAVEKGLLRVFPEFRMKLLFLHRGVASFFSQCHYPGRASNDHKVKQGGCSSPEHPVSFCLQTPVTIPLGLNYRSCTWSSEPSLGGT